MALLTEQDISTVAGATITYSAANASDTWKHTGQPAKLLVRTGATGAIQVTITTYKNVQGLTVPNRVLSGIGTNQDRAFPLDKDLYANPADGLVTIAITPTTNVTTAIVVN
jgi:hypothetical protein